MVCVSIALLALAGFSPLVRAQYGDYGGDPGYGGGGAPAPSPQPTPQPDPAGTGSGSTDTTPPPSSAAANTAVGDVQCGRVMCIGATVKGDTIQYVMQSTGAQPLGWMAMGFGLTMVGTPMVIMWTNEDRGISLSQREATDRSLPDVDPSPARVATPYVDLSMTYGKQPKLAYTIPMNSDMKPKIIWAYGTDMPSSGDPSIATFRQHAAFGRLDFDLTRTNANATILDSPALSLLPNSGGGSPSRVKTSSVDMVVLAHGVVCAIAYLVVMPAGALLARYYRTVSPMWFKGHWILQFAISAPIVLAGAALAFSISKIGGVKSWNTHTQVGVLLFVLYGTQCLLGGVIHFVKPKRAIGRPIQNYAHAVLGLTIIALAFFQVRTGYTREWVNATGRIAPKAIDVLWYVWVVALPLAYGGGLWLLKKQFEQERAARYAPKVKPWDERKGYTV